jgi:hypothetical protein
MHPERRARFPLISLYCPEKFPFLQTLRWKSAWHDLGDNIIEQKKDL